MKHILEVCLIAATLTAGVTTGAAQSSTGQTLQKGISVELAETRTAAPMPAADHADAWIVTVDGAGEFYFGADRVTLDTLAGEMIKRPRLRNQKLYIKADGRTEYANVEKAMNIGRAAELDAPVLLTAQSVSLSGGAPAPPMGSEVLLDTPAQGVAVTLQLFRSDHGQPVVKVDGQPTSANDLESALGRLLQNRREKTVMLKADGRLPYATVMRMIDLCRSAGARVVLNTAQMEI